MHYKGAPWLIRGGVNQLGRPHAHRVHLKERPGFPVHSPLAGPGALERSARRHASHDGTAHTAPRNADLEAALDINDRFAFGDADDAARLLSELRG